MISYLVGTRCPWGILTNGQIWRLYSREVSCTASEYYEVDLGAILAQTVERAISQTESGKLGLFGGPHVSSSHP